MIIQPIFNNMMKGYIFFPSTNSEGDLIEQFAKTMKILRPVETIDAGTFLNEKLPGFTLTRRQEPQ